MSRLQIFTLEINGLSIKIKAYPVRGNMVYECLIPEHVIKVQMGEDGTWSGDGDPKLISEIGEAIERRDG